MGSALVTVRAARDADEERLRELTFESKAHWGYDRDFVRRWAEGLTFEGEQERWVAEVDGGIVAWAGLVPPVEGVAVLDDLWVDPVWMGCGLGSRLFRVAADRARELGAERLEWGAERHARGFYERMGGRFLRAHVTEWGREGQWYGMEL
jgi:N-acetylglutamate synthase-like GNAT family acetyltransferase